MSVVFSADDRRWATEHLPGWKLCLKRAFDLMAALAATVVLVLPALLIALLVKVSSKGPLFFSQERVGYLGEPFMAYKFRTMVANAMELGGFETGEKDPRITLMGHFLRRWSLDEIPQIWNIIKGDMSFVGPRPTLAYQVDAYTTIQQRRLLAMPGLTGWAQVNGRNQLTWPEKIELDIEYIEKFSLWRDLKILWMTIDLVISKRGIYGDTGV